MSADAGATPGGAEVIRARLADVPEDPGVYRFWGGGRVLYVGKARNLRLRLAAYARGGDGRAQITFLVRRVDAVDWLVTRTEKEALLLESNLIKQSRPRYNIRLKDDKSYVSVKITADAWPRVVVTRRIVQDGGRYFGPFHSAVAIRETLDLIRKVFPLRTCSDGVFRNRTRPCLEYQIKRCLGPCVLPVDRDAYGRHLDAVSMLLEGRTETLLRDLEAQMAAAAQDLRYEEAARARDQIKAVRATGERQQVLSHEERDLDVIGIRRDAGIIEARVLVVRRGRLMAVRGFSLDDVGLPEQEILGAMVGQIYGAGAEVPPEILLPCDLEDAALREELLEHSAGRSVRIRRPRRGEALRLLELAGENAGQALAARRDAAERSERALLDLQKRLHLGSVPQRIECVDVSTFQGGQTVAAISLLVDGRPAPEGYRRYRVRRVEGTDDFESLREVVERRFRAALRDEQQRLPDLFVVDGGRAHLGVVLAVASEMGVSDLVAVGLAKARVTPDARSATIERSEERVFLRGRVNPVVLAGHAPARHILERVRDEAHRFAIRYHRQLRDRGRLGSSLEGIPGVGKERARRLLVRFGSSRGVATAPVEEIAAVDGIGQVLARRIRETLKA